MAERAALTPADIERSAELVKVLDSQTRLELLLLLSGGDCVVHELVHHLGKSQPLISQHLRVLRKAGLVTSRRVGREVVYALARPGVVDIIYDLADLATLDAARDELAERRTAREAADHGNRGLAGAAIIDPPAALRPERDPGLTPTTPKPERD